MNLSHCPYKVGDKLTFAPSERTISSYQDITLFGLIPGCVYQLKVIKEDLYLYFDEGGGFPFGEFRRATIAEIQVGNEVLKERYSERQKKLEEKKKNYFKKKFPHSK